MNPAPDISPPRRRFRQLRLAFAAFGLVLAITVVLFRPAGPGAANPVHLQLQRLTTNAAGKTEAVFIASNGWPRQSVLWNLNVEQKLGGEWLATSQQFAPFLALRPGEVAEVRAPLLKPETPWRVKMVWIVYPSRLTSLGFDLRATVGRILPSVDPDRAGWYNRHARTNHWPETVP